MSIEAMGSEFMRKYGASPKRKHKKRVRKSYSAKGWVNEPARHSMSAYGISSGRKQREYTPKTTFRSAPLLKAGLGLTVAGIGATARFLAKRKADADRKKAEEEQKKKEQQEKEDYYYDGQITPAREPLEDKIPFVKKFQEKQRQQLFREAQMKAMQQREDHYARQLEARINNSNKETKEEIEKDYASV